MPSKVTDPDCPTTGGQGTCPKCGQPLADVVIWPDAGFDVGACLNDKCKNNGSAVATKESLDAYNLRQVRD